MEDIPSDLKNLSENISSAWQGGNAEHYAGEINKLAGDLQSEIERIEYLSSRLNNEVAEWENVDATFGKVISSIAVATQAGKPWWEISKDIRDPVNTLMDFGKGLATAGIISGITVGTSYAGQVIFHGGQGLKDAAGLSSHLTHIKAANLPRHLFSQSSKISGIEVGMAAWEFAEKGAKDWVNYESGSEKAVAISIDALFVTGKTFLKHHVGYIAATAATTIATTALVAVAAPVAIVPIVITGVGLLAWWGGSQATGAALDVAYNWAETSGAKDSVVKSIGSFFDNVGKGMQNAARSVDQAFSPTVQRTIGI